MYSRERESVFFVKSFLLSFATNELLPKPRMLDVGVNGLSMSSAAVGILVPFQFENGFSFTFTS